ncbi:sushi domain-containing protein 5 [Pelodytes ibericus]
MAEGKLFTLESMNGTQSFDLDAAQKSCAIEGSRLATPEELRRVVLECSFTVCTKGWLANGVVGTTVCSKMGNEHQSGMEAIDVKTAVPLTTAEQYDAFCIKDEDKPCGDPPSFPHTILHGHTGFEMGDELLYICSQGYVMGRDELAFSLLCDSCGKWYGHVHSCVKDETETFIDYEDNFHDDKDMPDMESDNDEEDYDDDEHLEHHEFSLYLHNEQRNQYEDVRDLTSIKKADNKPTESPFSLLSQKHLFWFPPEVISGPQSEMEPYDITKLQHLNTINHKEIKSDYDEPVDKHDLDNTDFPVMNNNSKTNKNSTDYIGFTGLTVKKNIPSTKFQTSKVELRNAETATPSQNSGKNQMVSSFATATTLGSSEEQTELKPSIARKDVNTDKISANGMEYHTSSFTFLQNVFTASPSINDATDPVPTAAFHTVNPDSMLYNHNDAAVQATSAKFEFTLEQDARKFAADISEGTQIFATVQPCLGNHCPQVSKSQLIAIVVAILCLVLLSTIAAVWCYKKQQKSSMYNFSGKAQTSHEQHIEMQKI